MTGLFRVIAFIISLTRHIWIIVVVRQRISQYADKWRVIKSKMIGLAVSVLIDTRQGS
jgi:hypothetical protein